MRSQRNENRAELVIPPTSANIDYPLNTGHLISEWLNEKKLFRIVSIDCMARKIQPKRRRIHSLHSFIAFVHSTPSHHTHSNADVCIFVCILEPNIKIINR